MFLADDTQLGRRVAIKFLADGVADDGRSLERLHREAGAAAGLDHPYICKIHEITEVDGRPGIVMEHVSGETLQAELARTPVSPRRALQIAGEIAEALEEAHKKRVVHRDLKPANVMLTEQGHVKVMDFGLAKQVCVDRGPDDQTIGSLTDPGVRVGTPGYMAPEQLLGSDADERSDIFAFGVLLYELLAGMHPFKRSSHSGTMAAVLREPHPPVAQYAKRVPDAVQGALDRLLSKEPTERYQSFDEVLALVRRLHDETSGRNEPWDEGEPATQPSLGTRRTSYVGRGKEHAELDACVGRAIGGQGGIVLIGGEPGVGKTRLVEQVQATAHRRNCLTPTGRAYETEGSPPFIPFVEAIEQCICAMPAETLKAVLGDAAPEVARLVPDLRRQFPDIPTPLELPPEQQRRYLFKNIAEFVQRASRLRCMVILLDDLHWADEATLELLQHLAPLLQTWPVLVLGTYRDVELDVGRPFAQTLESLKRKRLATRLNLRRLEFDGVHAMLVALGGPDPPLTLVTAVFDETEGNPFFVEEVFQHLDEEGALLSADGKWRTELELEDLEVPEGVRLVVGRRLERVSPESQKVLTIGAIVGRSFDLDLLEAVGDVVGDALLTALEESEQAFLIVPTPGREPRWEFSHALIRQTLAASLSLPRRQRLHLRVADAIEQTVREEPEKRAADLAHHLYQAGTAAEADKTVHYLEVAGQQVFDAGSFEEGLPLVDRAHGLLDDKPVAQRAALLFMRGRVLHSVHRTEESAADYQRAFDLYETLGDVDGVTNASMEIAHQCSYRGEPFRAVPTVRRGLALTGDEQSVSRARLLSHGALSFGIAGDYDAARPMMDEAIALARRLDDRRALAEALGVKVFYDWVFLQCREWVDTGRQAVEVGQSLGQPWLWLPADALRRVGLASVGDWRAATDGLEKVAELAERLGQIQAINCHHDVRVLSQLMVGDIGGYERAAEAKRLFCVDVDYPWKFVAKTFLGLGAFWRGEWDEAAVHLKESYEQAQQHQTAASTWGN